MKTFIKHKDADVYIEKLPSKKNKIDVIMTNHDLFIPVNTCETNYPVTLIKNILQLKGPSFLCDEILRDESPDYVQKNLQYDIFGYLSMETFREKKLLDFGCGSGASTMIIARMLPHTNIVGIELEKKLFDIARLRVDYYGYKNIKLIHSPNPCELPQNIGSFDYIVLSGVYEHLLPIERKVLLPKLWNIINPGGVLFINQTPNRYFMIESHTTGDLPLINYMPDSVAFVYARHFSRTKLKNDTWEDLLRKGIRGGSINEILKILNQCSNKPILLNPCMAGIKDRLDLWYIKSINDRFTSIKKIFLVSAKLFKYFTGITVVPRLSLAIQKKQ